MRNLEKISQSNASLNGTREARPETRDEPKGRSERIPMGGIKSRLKVPELPGFYLRWINDTPGRLNDARRAGYEHVSVGEVGEHFGDNDTDQVNRDLGSKISAIVSRSTGMRAYLMKLPIEFREEDIARKQSEVDETDKRIHDGNLKSFDSLYVPDGGRAINIASSGKPKF